MAPLAMAAAAAIAMALLIADPSLAAPVLGRAGPPPPPPNSGGGPGMGQNYTCSDQFSGQFGHTSYAHTRAYTRAQACTHACARAGIGAAFAEK